MVAYITLMEQNSITLVATNMLKLLTLVESQRKYNQSIELVPLKPQTSMLLSFTTQRVSLPRESLERLKE